MLELVARYNYTSLNDVNEGEYYAVGRDQYYPNNYMEDWPYASSSVGGGTSRRRGSRSRRDTPKS